MATYIAIPIGSKHGALTVLEVIPKPKGADCDHIRCRCDCGREVTIRKYSLTAPQRRGVRKSCGCLSKTGLRTVGGDHGMSYTPTYKSWASMRGRVNGNVGTTATYEGVTQDPRWDDFEVFLEDMGERPSLDYTLDRIDNDKGYWPDNCRWLTKAEQSLNRKPWRHTPTGLARIAKNLPNNRK